MKLLSKPITFLALILLSLQSAAESVYEYTLPSTWEQRSFDMKLEEIPWIPDKRFILIEDEFSEPVFVFRTSVVGPWNNESLKKLYETRKARKEDTILLRHQPLKTKHHKGYYAEYLVQDGDKTLRAAIVLFDQDNETVLLLYQKESSDFLNRVEIFKDLVSKIQIHKKALPVESSPK